MLHRSAPTLILMLIFGMHLLFASPGIGQDRVEIGAVELERQNFNWYDGSNQSPQDLWRWAPSKSKTEARRNIATSTAAPKSYSTWDWSGLRDMFSVTTWIILGVIFFAVIAAIIWTITQMDSRLEIFQSASSEVEYDEEDLKYRIEQLPFQLNESEKGDLSRLAAKAAKSGDHGRAIMLLFSHVLILLDRRELIRLKKGKTNRQYLRELNSHSELRHYYEKVMVPFEDSFFGDHPVGKPRFDDCWNELDGFHRNVEKSIELVAVS